MPSIAIFGLGAMACLFASRLHPLVNVTLIGHWPQQRILLADPGLEVLETDGSTSHHRLHAVAPQAEPSELVDLALILVKSPQTQQVAQIAPRWLKAPSASSAGGLVLTLQNGIGNRETLSELLGKERTAQGVTLQAAHGLGAGRIRHAAEGPTSLGWEIDHRKTDPDGRLSTVIELFQQAGFPTDQVDDVESLMWGKLVLNAAINPLTALLRCTNGALLEDSRSRQLLALAAREVAQVAQASKIALPAGDPVAQAEAACRATAANRSSMLQDVLRGVTTEIDAICGAVVRAGAQVGIPTPVNRLFLNEVEALPARGAGPWSDPENAARDLLNALLVERFGESP
ncbi:MAG: ketopantoate reductase family protein [Deltaproteobacteria bacterium]|nr:ketopantoate reductase family protein [Deltaproteobacteria bacterium]